MYVSPRNASISRRVVLIKTIQEWHTVMARDGKYGWWCGDVVRKMEINFDSVPSRYICMVSIFSRVWINPGHGCRSCSWSVEQGK